MDGEGRVGHPAELVECVTDHSLQGIGPDGVVVTWNQGAQRLHGYTSDEILGSSRELFFTDQDRLDGSPQRALAVATRDGVHVVDAWQVRRDGSRFRARVSLTRLDGTAGGPVGFVAVTRDTSDEHRLVAMADLIQTVLGGASLVDALTQANRLAASLVDAPIAWIVAPINEPGRLGIVAGCGGGTDASIGAAVARASPPGVAMTDRRTISLPDLGDIETGLGLSEATRALIGPALFIPLHHDGLVMGALAVARTIGSHAFGTHEVGVVSLFADQAALALHTIHLRSELDRLGVLEDRERIARDLHDTVIQRLFATSMSLETTLSLVPSSVARKRIDEGIVELHDTIRSIRTTIFDLGRAEVGPITTGARQEILGVASDAARGLGFAPTVRFAGAVNAAVSDHVLDQLLPTLRELLSNVVRHARASAVDVAVIVAQDISLTVADDGIGLGRPGEERHRGLANITDRAVTLGGVTRIEHLEPGTQVTWRVPLPA